MSKIVIIGGGASGILASIKLSQNNEVILVDGEEKIGKKILLTGNGRCNYWNQDISIKNYHTDSYSNLEKIISIENQKEVFNYLTSLGIYPRVKNGYYYPYSNQASSIYNILINALKKNNVKVMTNFKVNDISKIDDKFIIKSNTSEIIADKVIVSTGGSSYSKTGSDGSGYNLLKKLSHTVNPIYPALVQLKSNSKLLKNVSGVRTEAKVTLLIDNKEVISDIGEVQLTDYGISGIVTLNISGIVNKYLVQAKKVEVSINFLPDIDNFYTWFDNRCKTLKNYTLEETLESVIPYKLMFMLIDKSKLSKDSIWSNLNINEKERLVNEITNFKLEIIGTNSFNQAQVTTGGISLKEINPNTMESTIIPNLYIVGEVLDVDGICGGYNLAFAFISAYIAARSIK